MKLQNLIYILIGIVCFGLLPRAQAVLPPPDGGYPNFNTAEGTDALFSNTTGNRNTGLGFKALYSNTTGSYNTATGIQALFTNTDGTNNTATGAAALLMNTGSDNTATGFRALKDNTFGMENTAIGTSALRSNIDGSFNTAVGSAALFSPTGSNNTAIGLDALRHTTGSGNTALGASAGVNHNTGNNNIYIGSFGRPFDQGTIRIGLDGTLSSQKAFIAGISGVVVSGAGVVVNAGGQLGVAASSARFKKDIKPMDNASEAILGLKPVRFQYKKDIDPAGTSQFGLVAEEVEKVNPDLVVHDKEGKPFTVRYDAVNAMLLNEFLKEHKEFVNEQHKVERLEATVAQQHKDFEAAVVELKGQIQKVSAQLEVSKPAPRTVLNNR